ncbi:hypothetical protein Anas_03036 [Armadillidium nasatum]|uniref:Uncharacterized protein n=1 Tax=Armadillidium nasatum TaxID=96803 RepID=A0A5N5TLA5_9CRUS|nr:hypothetical protein Anas_03036 [Armadillidium nasatum]
MKLDDGVDTEDSFAVATSSAAMPKFEVLTSLFIFLGEDAVLLYLLPLLLKSKINFASIKKNTFWKPYKRDMQEAFVIHVQNPEDVCHYIQKTRETFPNFFEHATICNFAEERPLNIAQILT